MKKGQKNLKITAYKSKKNFKNILNTHLELNLHSYQVIHLQHLQNRRDLLDNTVILFVFLQNANFH